VTFKCKKFSTLDVIYRQVSFYLISFCVISL